MKDTQANFLHSFYTQVVFQGALDYNQTYNIQTVL